MVGGKAKSEFKKHPLYKALSPFNFFRQNIVFEVSKNMTLSQIATEIFGKSQVFIKYPSDQEYTGTTTIAELLLTQEGSAILDLVVKKMAAAKADD